MVRLGKSCCMLFFSILFLPEERLEQNEGWQLCCQVRQDSLIRTRPVQVLGVSHNMVVDLPLEGLQVKLWREHRAGNMIPFPGCTMFYEKAQRVISACTIKVHCIRVPSAATYKVSFF